MSSTPKKKSLTHEVSSKSEAIVEKKSTSSATSKSQELHVIYNGESVQANIDIFDYSFSDIDTWIRSRFGLHANDKLRYMDKLGAGKHSSSISLHYVVCYLLLTTCYLQLFPGQYLTHCLISNRGNSYEEVARRESVLCLCAKDQISRQTSYHRLYSLCIPLTHYYIVFHWFIRQ